LGRCCCSRRRRRRRRASVGVCAVSSIVHVLLLFSCSWRLL
jgi:hypothetical protein